MRYAILIVLALAAGIIGTVMAMNAIHNKPNVPRSAMEMIDFHMDGLEKNVDDNRCTVTDNLPHLLTMRALSNDLEPVFMPTSNDADFKLKASGLRAALDAAIATPPADCAAIKATMQRVGHECKSCHNEFRH